MSEMQVLNMKFGYENYFAVEDGSGHEVEGDPIVDCLIENLYKGYDEIIALFKKQLFDKIITNKEEYNNAVKNKMVGIIFNSGFNIIGDVEEIVEIYKQPFQTRAEISWVFNIKYDESDNKGTPKVVFKKVEKIINVVDKNENKVDDRK